jgi:hypothetical protein
VDDLISALFPVPFPEWINPAKPYWVASVKAPKVSRNHSSYG